MIEIRIHGRGGQGNVVAAYVLAGAAFEEGKRCQAFPNFGAERRGAPVVAFVRISEKPILRRCQVEAPGFLLIQDESLLHIPSVLEGLKDKGGILVNSLKSSEELTKEYGRPMVALAGSQMAAEIVGKPLANVALLSAFLTLTGLLPLDALKKALSKRFRGEVLDKNLKLIDEVGSHVTADLWKKEAKHVACA
ncbi:MAG: 2-oxoacid:acceptor oxidoreductase family protein [Alphaproteobacteria bacterium]|nr:2-oxoacid:acceptor oxidoreductase family protein [Alphaproteobacteria bacterium]